MIHQPKTMDMCSFPQIKTIPDLGILRARRLKVTSGPSGPLFTPLREFLVGLQSRYLLANPHRWVMMGS